MSLQKIMQNHPYAQLLKILSLELKFETIWIYKLPLWEIYLCVVFLQYKVYTT
jgi:hypothetical protein